MIIVLFASLIVTGCAITPQTAKPATTPQTAVESDPKKIIVAKVNNTALTMEALIRMMNRLPAKGGGPDALEEHKKRSLDKLVLQELAYQQAKAQGLGIDADKIDMAIDNLKTNISGEQEFSEYLKQQGTTEADVRSEVERRLLLELAYAREVLDKVTIPEEEMRAEYEKVKHLYVQPEKVSVLDVFILKNNDKASRKKAKDLLKKIKADPDKDPWKLSLDGTFIVRNIDIPRETEKELYAAAIKLKPREVSGVIKTSNGLHIIKLIKYSPERPLTFDETKNSIAVKFKFAAQEKRMRVWEQELRKDAKITLMPDTLGLGERKNP